MTKQVELPEPEAMRGDYDGYGFRYIDNGSGSNWMNRNPNWEHLFTADQMRQFREEGVREALDRLQVRNWTEEMMKVWHLQIPDVYKAFEELIAQSQAKGES